MCKETYSFTLSLYKSSLKIPNYQEYPSLSHLVDTSMKFLLFRNYILNFWTLTQITFLKELAVIDSTTLVSVTNRKIYKVLICPDNLRNNSLLIWNLSFLIVNYKFLAQLLTPGPGNITLIVRLAGTQLTTITAFLPGAIVVQLSSCWACSLQHKQ